MDQILELIEANIEYATRDMYSAYPNDALINFFMDELDMWDDIKQILKGDNHAGAQ